MKIYSISIINEKLEVFECEYDNMDLLETLDETYVIEPSEVYHEYDYHKNEWVKERHLKTIKINVSYIFEGFDELLKFCKTSAVGDLIGFTTLEMAKASKVILVSMFIGIPDIEKPLKEIKNEYPEYFI